MPASSLQAQAENELDADRARGRHSFAAVMDRLWTSDISDRFTLTELVTPPEPPRFVLAPYLTEGCPVVLTGAGGTSKTGLLCTMAIAICGGLDFLGQTPKAGCVLIVSAEDRREALRRHVWANTQDLDETTRERVAGNLYVKDCVGSGFKLTRHINGQTSVAEDTERLIEYAAESGPFDLIAFDTLARLNGGEETNEDLSRIVEAMEHVSVATGACTLIVHHSGKGQMRDGINDQYSGRGGSALSDNSRGVMHLARVLPKTPDAPVNASDLIANGRLLRLSHVKSNYAGEAPDRYFERVPTPFAATLRPFAAEFAKRGKEANWKRIAAWLRTQTDVPYPTRTTIDGLGPEYGSRRERREAVDWAIDRGLVSEPLHPEPQGRRKHYLMLPQSNGTDAEAYARASKGG